MFKTSDFKILKIMKIFGFLPMTMKPQTLNYIIPIITSVFHMACVFCRISCLRETEESKALIVGSLNIILLYLDTFLMQSLFVLTVQRTTRKHRSWKILSELISSYPSRRKFEQSFVFITINGLYLLVLISESMKRDYELFECTVHWAYEHVSHYFAAILLYFIVQFLLIIISFYREMYNTMKNARKDRTVNYNFNERTIRRVRQKFSNSHHVIKHLSIIFGWSLCILVVSYINLILRNVRFLFYDAAKFNNFYYITPVIQIIIHTVSFTLYISFCKR